MKAFKALVVIAGLMFAGSSLYAAKPREIKESANKGTVHTRQDIYLNSSVSPSRKKGQSELMLSSGPAVKKKLKGKAMRQLQVPREILLGENANEFARVWNASGKNWIILKPDAFEDPLAWGLLLAAMAKHAAKAHCHVTGEAYEPVLERIKEGFDEEWMNSEDELV